MLVKKNDDDNLTQVLGREKMKFTEKDHNYIESDDERESGHQDTRYKNFECETKDGIGCNWGIDVAG